MTYEIELKDKVYNDLEEVGNEFGCEDYNDAVKLILKYFKKYRKEEWLVDMK